MDIDVAKSEPTCELYDMTVQRIKQTFTCAGVDIRSGLKLGRIFQEASLPEAHLILGARVEGGPDTSAYDYAAQTVRSILPLMERRWPRGYAMKSLLVVVSLSYPRW
jgi:hypothetical protein